jgi:DHA1 family bicyclomycin/chloramphenicol resistance-like MFS transporter
VAPRYVPEQREIRVRIPPNSIAFTLQLGFLVALHSFWIDMILPALTATGATLHVAPA